MVSTNVTKKLMRSKISQGIFLQINIPATVMDKIMRIVLAIVIFSIPAPK